MQYTELREDYLENMQDKAYLSLAAARDRRLVINFAAKPTPVPNFQGIKVRHVLQSA